MRLAMPLARNNQSATTPQATDLSLWPFPRPIISLCGHAPGSYSTCGHAPGLNQPVQPCPWP